MTLLSLNDVFGWGTFSAPAQPKPRFRIGSSWFRSGLPIGKDAIKQARIELDLGVAQCDEILSWHGWKLTPVTDA